MNRETRENMKPDLYVYVDVDDTLVRSAGTKRIPIPSIIQHVRNLKKQGAVLFCWSSGGAEYAKQSAQELGIDECFEAFLPKPNVMIDDQEISSWKHYQCVHPSNCSNRTLENYREDLEK
jgi:predicted HAD superfamily phosphohydrolase YqeG